ncbi:zinc finger BED domain-containing protein RICESLEEPER 2 [Tanacetum coccineum]
MGRNFKRWQQKDVLPVGNFEPCVGFLSETATSGLGGLFVQRVLQNHDCQRIMGVIGTQAQNKRCWYKELDWTRLIRATLQTDYYQGEKEYVIHIWKKSKFVRSGYTTALNVVPWETDGESVLREACPTRAREFQFPSLAVMARDLLSVQASTVAFKSAFSVSGRVISPRRTKLTPTSVEVLICLKHHFDSVERIQHISPLEGEL